MDIVQIIANLFNPKNMSRVIKKLSKLETVVYDTIFKNRPQKAEPYVSVQDVFETIQTVPLIRRGGSPVNIGADKTLIQTIEPLQLRPSEPVSAVDLNNLKMLGDTGREAWMRERTEKLRRIVRRSIEGMCAQSVTGQITWPIQIEGGFENYSLDYSAGGENPKITKAPDLLFSDANATVSDVLKHFIAMRKLLTRNGYGDNVEIWAGEDAYSAIAVICERYISTAERRDIRVENDGEVIRVGAFRLKLRSEEYRHPQTGVFTPIIASDSLMMFSLSADNKNFYCSLDDFDANLNPLPMFIKPVKRNDVINLVATSKPLPVPVLQSICWSTVV
jgi:hypothetical protein